MSDGVWLVMTAVSMVVAAGVVEWPVFRVVLQGTGRGVWRRAWWLSMWTAIGAVLGGELVRGVVRIVWESRGELAGGWIGSWLFRVRTSDLEGAAMVIGVVVVLGTLDWAVVLVWLRRRARRKGKRGLGRPRGALTLERMWAICVAGNAAAVVAWWAVELGMRAAGG